MRYIIEIKQLKFFLYSLITLCFFYFESNAQLFKAKVVDTQTKQALPFVSITSKSQPQGTTSDIDGLFTVNATDTIYLSYVGYKPLTYNIHSSTNSLIYLEKQITQLKEVEILPGINPAELVIKKVIANKKINDPSKIPSYTYTAYNKFYYSSPSIVKDSTDFTKKKSVMDDIYLFMMETVTEHLFKAPDKEQKKVLAHKISGLNDPSFTLLFTQLQQFGFYKNDIDLFDKHYFNPIATGGIDKYLFIIEDTLYQNKDSVFILSFKPRNSKSFNSLQGLLYINSNRYAIQNVIAEPTDKNGNIFKVQQLYEFIDGKYWFPKQLNTEVMMQLDTTKFKVQNEKNRKNYFKINAIGLNYIKDVTFDIPISNSEFTPIDNVIMDDAGKHTSKEYWDLYRPQALTQKEIRTYEIVDSISEKYHLETKVKLMESLLINQLPVKFFNIDLTKLLRVNEYEGVRIGLGGSINNKLSRYFSIGGYAAYGFGDKAFKWGSSLEIYPFPKKEFLIGGTYNQDVIESGGTTFYNENTTLSNTELYRNLRISRMDSITKTEAYVSWRMFKFLNTKMYANQQNRKYTKGYIFDDLQNNYKQNTIYETGINLYYAYNEKFYKLNRFMVSEGTNYPVIRINIATGKTNYTTYNRVDLKVTKLSKIHRLGILSITAMGGYIHQGNKPLEYSLLYNGRGNYNKKYNLFTDSLDIKRVFDNFSVYADNSFQTMQMNEFLSDRYVSLFVKHTFNPIFSKNKKLHLNLSIIHATMIGDLANASVHKNISFNIPNKPFYESGFCLDNVYQFYGLGFFYRYGTNTSARITDNFVIKFSTRLSF